jgi:hypothetical protein
MADIGELNINLNVKTKGLDKGLNTGSKKLKKFERDTKKATDNIKKSTSKMNNSFGKLGAGILAAFSVRAIKNFAEETIKAANVQIQAEAQVQQALKSTRQIAGKNFKELKDLATDLQKTTLFGDEDILQNATAQLLTFTNIAGKNFDRTQKAALDLATRLGGDLKSASIQLGKALNDPVANLSALSRSGIQFSNDQKKVIKELVKTNQLAKAQTIILDELDKQYGGSAEAAANAAGGGLKQFRNMVGDIKESIGTALIPALEGFAKGVMKLRNSFNEALTSWKELKSNAEKGLDADTSNLVSKLTKIQNTAASLATFFSTGQLLDVSFGPKSVAKGSKIKGGRRAAGEETALPLTDPETAKGITRVKEELIPLISTLDEGDDKLRQFAISFGTLRKEMTDTIDEPLAKMPAVLEKIIPLNERLAQTFEDVAKRGGASLRDLANAAIDAAKEFVRAKLVEALSAAISKSFLFSGNPIIGLGIAAVASAGITSLFNKIPSLAQGGIAFNPTLAMVGDASSPEVIAPLDKLQGMIGDNNSIEILKATKETNSLLKRFQFIQGNSIKDVSGNVTNLF